MEKLTPSEETILMNRIAKEFLQERLGVQPTPKNVALLTRHIQAFEQEIARQGKRKFGIKSGWRKWRQWLKSAHRLFYRREISLLGLLSLFFTLSGCSQYTPETQQQNFTQALAQNPRIIQKPATANAPAAYWVCGDVANPCPVLSPSVADVKALPTPQHRHVHAKKKISPPSHHQRKFP